MTFSHVSIRASDMDGSIAFYRDFFGMELTQRRPIPQNKAEIAFLKDPGAEFSLELTHYDAQTKFEQADYPNRVFDHLAFRVKDLRGMVERIRKAGFVISDEPFELSPGKWLAFVEDPDGTLIELIQFKDEKEELIKETAKGKKIDARTVTKALKNAREKVHKEVYGDD